VKLRKRFGLFAATVFCLVILCPRALPEDKAGIVNKARAMYYNLAAHGVKEFRCDVAPDWKEFLASTRNHAVPDNDPELKRLGLLRFELEATLGDEPKVTPSTLGPIVLDENVLQLISGVKQTVRGFFETWRGFMITNPFDGSDVESLEEGPDNYRISTKAPGLEAKTVMTKDFTITEVLANYGESKVRVAPRFTATKEGLLLDRVSNEIDGGKTRLVETIEYAEVDGLKLPGRVHIDVTQPGGQFVIDVGFSNYQVRRK
jgi:hypothetical protein